MRDELRKVASQVAALTEVGVIRNNGKGAITGVVAESQMQLSETCQHDSDARLVGVHGEAFTVEVVPVLRHDFDAVGTDASICASHQKPPEETARCYGATTEHVAFFDNSSCILSRSKPIAVPFSWAKLGCVSSAAPRVEVAND